RRVPRAPRGGPPPLPHHLSAGEYAAAEGGGAHPRWVLDQDLERLRLRPRCRRGGPALLAQRPRLAHEPAEVAEPEEPVPLADIVAVGEVARGLDQEPTVGERRPLRPPRTPRRTDGEAGAAGRPGARGGPAG